MTEMYGPFRPCTAQLPPEPRREVAIPLVRRAAPRVFPKPIIGVDADTIVVTTEGGNAIASVWRKGVGGVYACDGWW